MEEKPEEIVTLEELKNNIEYTLREIKALSNPSIEDQDVESFLDDNIRQLMNYGLLNHETVNNLVAGFKQFIRTRERIDNIIEKLLINIREAMLWQKIKDMKENEIRKS